MPKKAKAGRRRSSSFTTGGLGWPTSEEMAITIITLWISTRRATFSKWLVEWAGLLDVTMAQIAKRLEDAGETRSGLSYLSRLINNTSSEVYTQTTVREILLAFRVSPFWVLVEREIMTPPEGVEVPMGPYSLDATDLAKQLRGKQMCRTFRTYLKEQHNVKGPRAGECLEHLVKLGVWALGFRESVSLRRVRLPVCPHPDVLASALPGTAVVLRTAHHPPRHLVESPSY